MVEKEYGVQGRIGTPLQAAAYVGNEKFLRQLLKEEALSKEDDFDMALQAAANAGHREIVVQAAANAGYREIVDVLLQHGADVNAREGPFGTALSVALDARNEEIVLTLLARGADATGCDGPALFVAAKAGKVELVRKLLSQGANINWDKDGKTALSAALDAGRGSIARMLLEQGADATGCLRAYNKALS